MNELRFIKYQSLQIKSSFKLEKLPPTEGAAKEHSLRSYWQLQSWLGNKKNPLNWGWKPYMVGISPKYTDEKLIPDELLKKICCGCSKGCGSMQCGCRKHGLQCTNLCTNCDCDNCSNFEKIVASDLSDAEDIESEGQATDFSTVRVHNTEEIEELVSGLQSDEEDESEIEAEPELEPPKKKQKL